MGDNFDIKEFLNELARILEQDGKKPKAVHSELVEAVVAARKYWGLIK